MYSKYKIYFTFVGQLTFKMFWLWGIFWLMVKIIFKFDDFFNFFSEHHEPAEKDDVSSKKEKSYTKNSSSKDDKKEEKKKEEGKYVLNYFYSVINYLYSKI